MRDLLPRPNAAHGVRNWDALAALIAALIGVMALLVSGYTAYIQRQQVRAQVWPHLLVGNYDPESAIKVLNKGVGPAIVRSVQMWVDGKPMPDWKHALAALEVPIHGMQTSTLSDNVLSPGESVTMIKLFDEGAYQRFRAAFSRVKLNICFCSTLEECWLYSDHAPAQRSSQDAVEQCPRLPDGEAFTD